MFQSIRFSEVWEIRARLLFESMDQSNEIDNTQSINSLFKLIDPLIRKVTSPGFRPNSNRCIDNRSVKSACGRCDVCGWLWCFWWLFEHNALYSGISSEQYQANWLRPDPNLAGATNRPTETGQLAPQTPQSPETPKTPHSPTCTTITTNTTSPTYTFNWPVVYKCSNSMRTDFLTNRTKSSIGPLPVGFIQR